MAESGISLFFNISEIEDKFQLIFMSFLLQTHIFELIPGVIQKSDNDKEAPQLWARLCRRRSSST
jgi:hypothetical protein